MKITARIAQSVERETFNLKVEGSTPSSGALFFLFASNDKAKLLLIMVAGFPIINKVYN